MAITLLTSVTGPATPDANGGASSAIDTTGANLIVVMASYYRTVPASDFTDSKGNTWTALTERILPDIAARIFYCVNPTVGTGHTFSFADGGTAFYSSFGVRAYWGVGGGFESGEE